MVCSKQDYISLCLCSLNHFLYACIHSRNSLADRFIHTSVADHIAVCEVKDDQVIASAVDCVNEFVCNLRCAHLRLKVVCRYLRRVHEDTVLVLEKRLCTTVEEECHMGIFFCLCNAELILSCLGYDLSESLLYVFLVEKDVQALE